MSPGAYVASFAVGLVLVIVLFLVITAYNDVMALQRRIDKAWANIEVILKQRHDQLPALVAAVKGLMAFEQDVLTEVTRARAAYAPTDTIPHQAATSDQTSSAVRSLLVTVERYPDIKAAGNVADLQAEIERIEGMLADRRELYNDQVYRYDTRIAQVPTSWLAAVFRWRPRAYFRADPGDAERPDTSLTTDGPA